VICLLRVMCGAYPVTRGVYSSMMLLVVRRVPAWYQSPIGFWERKEFCFNIDVNAPAYSSSCTGCHLLQKYSGCKNTSVYSR
jgi:hypothetical protein